MELLFKHLYSILLFYIGFKISLFLISVLIMAWKEAYYTNCKVVARWFYTVLAILIEGLIISGSYKIWQLIWR